jgi:NAD(P)-dependent dehydrogenase (short-subunit alcohol dehydrogenase family)
MDLQLNGRQALVSGSTAGMGYAMAEALVHDVARRGGLVEALSKQGKDDRGGGNRLLRALPPPSLLQRFSRPDETAAMVACVASPLASATTAPPSGSNGGVLKSAL